MCAHSLQTAEVRSPLLGTSIAAPDTAKLRKRWRLQERLECWQSLKLALSAYAASGQYTAPKIPPPAKPLQRVRLIANLAPYTPCDEPRRSKIRNRKENPCDDAHHAPCRT